MYISNDDLIVRKENDDMYTFFNIHTQQTIVFNSTAYIIYETCCNYDSLDTIVKNVCKATLDDVESARSEIIEFINKLEKEVIIRKIS